MIEEQARVVAVGKDFAEVETLRKSACGHCAANGACGTSLLARIFPERTARLRVPVVPGIRPGDEVTIGLDESSLQRASLLLYLVPILGLLGGAMLPALLPVEERSQTMELLSIASGLLGLTAGLLSVAFISRHARSAERSEVTILNVSQRAVYVGTLS